MFNLNLAGDSSRRREKIGSFSFILIEFGRFLIASHQTHYKLHISIKITTFEWFFSTKIRPNPFFI